VDVEAVREQERGPGCEVRRDLGVDLRLYLVGEEERDDLRVPHDLGRRSHHEARILCGGARCAAFAEADLDVDTGVVEVQGVRVALAAVPEYGDLAGEEVEVAFAVDRCHLCVSFVVAVR
jgi:hypothetical protein